MTRWDAAVALNEFPGSAFLLDRAGGRRDARRMSCAAHASSLRTVSERCRRGRRDRESRESCR